MAVLDQAPVYPLRPCRVIADQCQRHVLNRGVGQRADGWAGRIDIHRDQRAKSTALVVIDRLAMKGVAITMAGRGAFLENAFVQRL